MNKFVLDAYLELLKAKKASSLHFRLFEILIPEMEAAENDPIKHAELTAALTNTLVVCEANTIFSLEIVETEHQAACIVSEHLNIHHHNSLHRLIERTLRLRAENYAASLIEKAKS